MRLTPIPAHSLPPIKRYRLPGRVLTRTLRVREGQAVNWKPAAETISRVPLDAGLVHIIGYCSDDQIRELLEKCGSRRLHTVEVSPNQRKKAEGWIPTFKALGIQLQLGHLNGV